MLDPDVAALLASLPPAVTGRTRSLNDRSLQATRAAFSELEARPLTGAVDLSVHVVDEVHGVTIRVHRPKDAAGDLPCIYWMHGGGLVLGSAAVDDARFDRWCARFGIIGVSVDYRLAPETPYPGPLEDCYTGLQWVHAHSAELGIDSSWIGVGGASAGGGLAAGLSLLARDRAGLTIACALLIAPMLDDRAITVSSAWDDPVWSPPANRYGWSAYLGEVAGGPDVPPYAAAARATDLTGMPATFIGVGALDPLSDEGIDYAVRLRHAGVPVELHVYAGAPHGFDAVTPTAPIAQRARHDQEMWLETRLRQRTANPPREKDVG